MRKVSAEGSLGKIVHVRLEAHRTADSRAGGFLSLFRKEENCPAPGGVLNDSYGYAAVPGGWSSYGMNAGRWIIVGLVVFTAGWMLFDGTRAMISGEYAGQLGPWAGLVKAAGIEPRSALMKSIFVIYGIVTLGILAGFLIGLSWAPIGLITACLLGLWYLPFGTITNTIVLALLLFERK